MSAVVERIIALFGGLTQDQIEKLPPATRERFRALCGHWAGAAKTDCTQTAGAGVLTRLSRGEGAENSTKYRR
jgi:hypothetical protein